VTAQTDGSSRSSWRPAHGTRALASPGYDERGSTAANAAGSSPTYRSSQVVDAAAGSSQPDATRSAAARSSSDEWNTHSMTLKRWQWQAPGKL
jgi:hypothetical protein